MPYAASPTGWRVLVALRVYDGEEFARPCMDSLAVLDPGGHDVDVLVLDDASPAPGWSERCRSAAESKGFDYYRTPRNLGIPRNTNLGLLRAVDAGYDAVILLNSDTVLPRNLVGALIRPLIENPSIGSTTSWSNNVSIYSLPNGVPDHLGADAELVNWISEQVELEFGSQVIPVPTGVGFCMALPTSVIDRVGLMDPLFGRGYSEEIDWCLRSRNEGFSSVLAPSCFVYHAGSGITQAEGRIRDGNQIVDAHQSIIDERYPDYRSELLAFTASTVTQELRERGLRAIVRAAARDRGYRVEVSRLSHRTGDESRVRFVIEPDAEVPVIRGWYEGFCADFAVEENGVIPTVTSIVGRSPEDIRIFSRGPASEQMLQDLGGVHAGIVRQPAYCESVF